MSDDPKWHIDGTLIYQLEPWGWRNGEQLKRNRLTVSVQGNLAVTKEEVETLAQRIAEFLNTPTDAPNSDVTTSDLLDALSDALKYAEFERHPFRPWHDKARAAIAKATAQPTPRKDSPMQPILPGPGDLLTRKPFISLTPAQARNLFGSPSLIRARGGYLQTARNCREGLIDPNGPWGYGRDDERVREAVGKWVARARKAHRLAFGMERRGL